MREVLGDTPGGISEDLGRIPGEFHERFWGRILGESWEN